MISELLEKAGRWAEEDQRKRDEKIFKVSSESLKSGLLKEVGDAIFVFLLLGLLLFPLGCLMFFTGLFGLIANLIGF